MSTWRAAGFSPERHVGHPQRGVGAGQLGFDPPDGLDGGQAVFAQVVAAGGQRERQSVEDQVGRGQAVALHCQAVESVGHPHLPLQVPGLAFLIDEQAHHRGAVLAGQRQHPVQARPLALAVFQVGRVEDGSTADPLQAGLHHVGLGGVQHQRGGHPGSEPTGQLVHVGGAVAPHIVDAQIQKVGALAHLVAGDLEAAVPVGLQHGVAELAGAVGVGALTHDEKGRVLGEGHCGVEGSG